MEPAQQPKGRWVVMAITIALIVSITYNFLLSAPPQFEDGKVVHIEQGWTVSEVAKYLHDQAAIRSPWLFKVIAKLSGKQSSLIAGYYVLDNRPSAVELFSRLVRGEYHLVPMRVTVPEGATTEEIGLTLAKRIPGFDLEMFNYLTADQEGYLFPDTYFFTPDMAVEDIVLAMQDNLNNKLQPLSAEIEESGRSLNEILTMASLLEEEANTSESRKVISGILWKRIKAGMPLQVDAVFPYILGKNTFELTLDDLKIDSPYNTYKYKGLPPAPISNPGLDSIIAALSPESSPYWFYLSDMRGNMHYSQNYDQHKQKKNLYLP